MLSRMLALALAVFAAAIGAAAAAEPIRLLYFSKSAGFQHSVVERKPGEDSYSDKIVKALAAKMGATVTCSKDGRLISAAELKNFDVAVFYTTGDLTTEGTDKEPPMSATGQQELLEWIKAGGGFIGLHCATDTFHTPEGGEITPFVEMICGEFLTHGRQFEGKVKVVSPGHPAIAAYPDGFEKIEEWYIFKNLNAGKMHALALLDPAKEARRDERYNIPPYPFAWVRGYGEGRVFYNAMGHREDVWDHPVYQQNLMDAIRWANGEGSLNADPNYAAVVPQAANPPAASGEK